MACHETYLIEEFADRIYEIKDGRLEMGYHMYMAYAGKRQFYW